MYLNKGVISFAFAPRLDLSLIPFPFLSLICLMIFFGVPSIARGLIVVMLNKKNLIQSGNKMSRAKKLRNFDYQ